MVSPGAMVSTGAFIAENWRWKTVGLNSWRFGGRAGAVGAREAGKPAVVGWLAKPSEAVSVTVVRALVRLALPLAGSLGSLPCRRRVPLARTRVMIWQKRPPVTLSPACAR